MVFGLVRGSKYEELRKDRRESIQRISQLQKEADSLRAQREELSNSVEILTKEREIFQKTIQNLTQAARKRKKGTSP